MSAARDGESTRTARTGFSTSGLDAALVGIISDSAGFSMSTCPSYAQPPSPCSRLAALGQDVLDAAHALQRLLHLWWGGCVNAGAGPATVVRFMPSYRSGVWNRSSRFTPYSEHAFRNEPTFSICPRVMCRGWPQPARPP